MTPFLFKIAQLFHTRYDRELYRHTFIFPNRRAGIFFQKYLAEIAQKPIFSPKVITIHDFFEEHSIYKQADKTELLVLLYNQFTKLNKSGETFDDFLYWGEMLLNDFSDIDKHLADATQLFLNISNLRSMEEQATYLTEEQVSAIRQFWENFIPYENNNTKSEFLETWQILSELYTAFREKLHEAGYAYEGMLFRDVAERIAADDIDKSKLTNLVFVGLNALTPAETKVLRKLKSYGAADFYWDYESPLIKDKKNRASFWIEENLKQFPMQFELKDDDPAQPEKTTVQLIGIPSGAGQAKVVNQLLEKLLSEKKISEPDAGLNTAVVLPDENLLLPVLYSIPQEIEKINVTMGYSLQNASVASLMTAVASLQNSLKETGAERGIYYKFVLAILNHPLIVSVDKVQAEKLKTYIINHNRIVLTEEELHVNPFFELLFTIVQDRNKIATYLRSILAVVYTHLDGAQEHDGTEPTTEEAEAISHRTRAVDLEKEFIVHYYKTVTRLEESLTNISDLQVSTYFRLLKQLAQRITVNFTGEPLSGLQIMGTLETRVLDFENLIILSMNEGVFPLKSPTHSFIPYSLRKAFDLPTYEHQDSTYAYHFYRMISRAKRVFMLYDTRSEEMQTGEVSRYFYQLRFLYNDHFTISEKTVGYDVSSQQPYPIVVTKSDEIMRKLEQFKAGGTRALSASLINNYINCPLQFYFTAIEGLAEEEEVRETVESDIFGTIYHEVMQNLYDRYKNETVLPDTLNAMIKNETMLIHLLESAFATHYFKQKDKKRKLTGQHHLIAEVLRELIKQTLRVDRKITPFVYLDSEHRFNAPYRVNRQLSVNAKGSIDRIDQTREHTRIIDYKSGTGELKFSSMEQLFDGSKERRPYQILQVLFYALFYKETHTKISPAIYYLRKIYEDNFESALTYDKQLVTDVSALLPEFTQHLNQVLKSIFDPETPFAQTTNEKNCQWCAFKDLCGRS